ncbi:reverse transcriptase domain-containing protein [Tanacetum coccineum]
MKREEVSDIILEEEDNWMTPISEYLISGILPLYQKLTRKIRVKSPLYRLIGDNLDAVKEIQKYEAFQMLSKVPKMPKQDMTSVAWPFSQWVIDIIGLKIQQSFTSIYHPQGNGQVEVTNRDIIKGIEKRLGRSHHGWVDELLQVLWAHKTHPKSSHGETHFSLTYGTEAVIPSEISVETERIEAFKASKNDERL